MDSILPDVAKVFSTVMAKKLVDVLADHMGADFSSTKKSIEPHLLKHLNETVVWSGRNEFYGLSNALGVDDSTIELDISTSPRKFVGKNKTRDLNENDLLSLDGHYILLGDPGSGKTTTVKRLCRKLLTEDSVSEDDTFQYPVVIRFRRIRDGKSLFTEVADCLGLDWKKEEFDYNDRVSGKASNEEPRIFVGDLLLEEAVIKALDNTNAILLLDGLDEAKSTNRISIETEIVTLAHNLSSARILLTTRSGDFSRNIEGMDVLEISPLTDEQIYEIARRWLDRPNDFISTVEKLPYRDTLSRPLTLIQVMVLYKNGGYLLEQPSWMYGKLISLYLEEWDHHNGVNRKTKYSYFESDRKKEFLASLAFHLTYHSGDNSFSFSSIDLERTYLKINKSFGLPENEAANVVKEIEAHNGIILQSGPDEFEFSHLTFQEYLAAHFLVRDPFMDNLDSYLTKYPGPVAIAVVLASDPIKWLANLFIREGIKYSRGSNVDNSVAMFLRRLNIEKPNFNVSGILGFVFIALAIEYAHNDSINHELSVLCENESVRESLESAISAYEVVDISEDKKTATISLKRINVLQNRIRAVNYGRVRTGLFEGILKS